MNNSAIYQPDLSKMYRLEKIEDLCKTMISQCRSKQLLNQYEDSSILKTNSKLNDKVRKEWKYYQYFDLSQMINIKGNKKHQNPDLKRFLCLKLYTKENINFEARKQLWMQFTDIKENKGLYETVKSQTSSQRYFDETIMKDLHRTVGSAANLKMTENVLTTIAKYNPFIGYCQGFNNIIMFLIEEGFTEEQTFFIWKYISLEILPTDYYTSMISVLSDVDIILAIFSIMSPQCAGSIAANKQKLTSLILPWLICLFTREPVQEHLTRMFWDLLLVQGLMAIYKAALALLKSVQDIIEHSEDEQMIRKSEQKIKKLTQQSQGNTIKTIMENIYINPRILTLCRSSVCLKYQQKQNQCSYRRKPAFKQCNPNSHICIQELQNNRYELKNRSHQCQVFKIKQPIKLISNYLDTLEQKDHCLQKKKTQKQEDTILLGRIDHVCINVKNQDFTDDDEDRPRTESKLFNYRGMERTESMAFFEVLMENPTFSNLFDNDNLWGDNVSQKWVFPTQQPIQVNGQRNSTNECD